MSIGPERELADFLDPLPPWVRKVLQWDYSLLTPEEWLEHNRQQDETAKLRGEYERILRQAPPKWNHYCKAQKRFFAAAGKIEATLTLAKGLAGRPSKNALARKAARLKNTGLSYAEVAKNLNKAGGLKPSDNLYVTGESIRKLLKRHKASQAPTPDKN